jgi:hypothetical protein
LKIEFRLDAKGIGDAVCGVYTACGLADRGHLVTFHAKHTEWLKWFSHPNLTIIPERDPKVFNANEGYEAQLEASKKGECNSRSSWYMQNVHQLHPNIKGTPQPARPLNYEKVGGCKDLPADYILLAPFSAYENRQWNMQHWRMLAKVLMNEGHNVIAIGAHGHAEILRENFSKTGVRFFWGQTPEWTVKAICNSQVLIGNDSGPAHIAGLYNANAIALCGQVDGHFVYRHSPSVLPVHPPENVPCAKCHWMPDGGYSNMCANACSALQLISPFEVADLALQKINGEKVESIPSQKGGRQVDLSGTAVPWIQQTNPSPEGQPEEEDGAGQEGGRSEASPVRSEGLPGLHSAQGPKAPRELPKKVGGNKKQIRKTNKG